MPFYSDGDIMALVMSTDDIQSISLLPQAQRADFRERSLSSNAISFERIF